MSNYQQPRSSSRLPFSGRSVGHVLHFFDGFPPSVKERALAARAELSARPKGEVKLKPASVRLADAVPPDIRQALSARSTAAPLVEAHA